MEKGHVVVGRNDVNTVPLNCHAILDLEDFQVCVVLHQLSQNAFVVRGEMLHQHKGHARIHAGGQTGEEGFKGSQATRRSADAYDGKALRGLSSLFPFLDVVLLPIDGESPWSVA